MTVDLICVLGKTLSVNVSKLMGGHVFLFTDPDVESFEISDADFLCTAPETLGLSTAQAVAFTMYRNIYQKRQG